MNRLMRRSIRTMGMRLSSLQIPYTLDSVLSDYSAEVCTPPIRLSGDSKRDGYCLFDLTEVYRRDYGSPDVLHFGKNPLQWCKKLIFTDTYVCALSLSLKFARYCLGTLGRLKLMKPGTHHAIPSSALTISSSTRMILLLELTA